MIKGRPEPSEIDERIRMQKFEVHYHLNVKSFSKSLGTQAVYNEPEIISESPYIGNAQYDKAVFRGSVPVGQGFSAWFTNSEGELVIWLGTFSTPEECIKAFWDEEKTNPELSTFPHYIVDEKTRLIESMFYTDES